MADYPDVLCHVRAHLLADPTIVSLINFSGVSAVAIPAAIFPESHILLRRVAGIGADLTVPIITPSIEIRCYGIQPEDSGIVYNRLLRAFHGKNFPITTLCNGISISILWAKEEVSGEDLVDEDGDRDGFPYIRSVWQIGIEDPDSTFN